MKKLKTMMILIFVGYLLVFLGLLRLQYFPSHFFSDDADYIRSLVLQAIRGNIYDADGEMLARSNVAYDIFVDPKKLDQDKSKISRMLEVLGLSEATFEAKLASGSARWASIASNIKTEQQIKLKTVEVDGLHVIRTQNRDYKEASLAAHILGFYGKNSSGVGVGYYGLEGYYDSELKGIDGRYFGERDLTFRPIFFGIQDNLESQNGRDLYLTVSIPTQSIIKNKLKRAVELHRPKQACVIAANPQNMQILGSVCLPDFDPRKYPDFDQSTYKNPIVSDVYEPGSTFKPLIVAAALESESLKVDEMLDEPGPIKVEDKYVSTWDDKYRGRISVADTLAQSSNVGMVEIGRKLGNKNVVNWIGKFGFGEPTGIDLQGEVAGSFGARKIWYPIDYAAATFGQGLSVTPIQLVTAFAALVNGGELLRPYVVKSARQDDRVYSNNEKTVVRKILKTDTSDMMKKLLEYTVDNAEYRWSKPAGYTYGGKTGTAQIAVTGGYDRAKTVASFIGFTPVSNPKLIMLVIMFEPQSSEWGSETAAPLFFEIAKDLNSYYNILPEY